MAKTHDYANRDEDNNQLKQSKGESNNTTRGSRSKHVASGTRTMHDDVTHTTAIRIQQLHAPCCKMTKYTTSIMNSRNVRITTVVLLSHATNDTLIDALPFIATLFISPFSYDCGHAHPVQGTQRRCV